VAAYPEAGLAFHRILDLAQVMHAGDTRVSDLRVPYFAFDKDVLSLHRPSAVKELLVDADMSILHEASQVRRHL
jgi:hypothetical protein